MGHLYRKRQGRSQNPRNRSPRKVAFPLELRVCPANMFIKDTTSAMVVGALSCFEPIRHYQFGIENGP
ncbi:hypothetical protein M0804_002521 [Polistes exclamans]|nr:hypothetical protein M0804_002521 [Polistes exclamans]